jgi:hypothetical protein
MPGFCQVIQTASLRQELLAGPTCNASARSAPTPLMLSPPGIDLKYKTCHAELFGSPKGLQNVSQKQKIARQFPANEIALKIQ